MADKGKASTAKESIELKESDPGESAVLEGEAVEGLTAETVSMTQSNAGTIEAADVQMRQSFAQAIHAERVEMRQSGAQAVKANEVAMHQSGVLAMHAEKASLEESRALFIASDQVTGGKFGSAVMVGQEVKAEQVRAGLLLARRVDGPVEAWLDQRGALTLGIALGMVFGLLSLVRALLVRRD